MHTFHKTGLKKKIQALVFLLKCFGRHFWRMKETIKALSVLKKSESLWSSAFYLCKNFWPEKLHNLPCWNDFYSPKLRRSSIGKQISCVLYLIPLDSWTNQFFVIKILDVTSWAFLNYRVLFLVISILITILTF